MTTQLRAAIYARFSTDMQKDTSIEDQVRSCRDGVCQTSCPPISCSVSDFRGADFGFWIEPDGSGGLPVAGFA
jgi:hypothetical protein